MGGEGGGAAERLRIWAVFDVGFSVQSGETETVSGRAYLGGVTSTVMWYDLWLMHGVGATLGGVLSPHHTTQAE